jgi:hypothetical protein
VGVVAAPHSSHPGQDADGDAPDDDNGNEAGDRDPDGIN